MAGGEASTTIARAGHPPANSSPSRTGPTGGMSTRLNYRVGNVTRHGEHRNYLFLDEERNIYPAEKEIGHAVWTLGDRRYSSNGRQTVILGHPVEEGSFRSYPL